MKFYKVISSNIHHRVIGNSTIPLKTHSPIMNKEYIKVNEYGLVWTTFGQKLFRSKKFSEYPEQLILSEEELKTLFVECENPGEKVISNIKFIVGIANGFFEDDESFDNVEDATRFCQNKNDTDHNECYQVRVEFDANWET